ncbi:MAG: hypothetical protein ACKPKO_41810, partial [Candidatus Fonsibacter sp.]
MYVLHHEYCPLDIAQEERSLLCTLALSPFLLKTMVRVIKEPLPVGRVASKVVGQVAQTSRPQSVAQEPPAQSVA